MWKRWGALQASVVPRCAKQVWDVDLATRRTRTLPRRGIRYVKPYASTSSVESAAGSGLYPEHCSYCRFESLVVAQTK